MINEELNAALYEKMSAEQDQFVGWLLKLAVEEMLEHSFFVFLNSETQKVNVVYKRTDGEYGLLDPMY